MTMVSLRRHNMLHLPEGHLHDLFIVQRIECDVCKLNRESRHAELASNNYASRLAIAYLFVKHLPCRTYDHYGDATMQMGLLAVPKLSARVCSVVNNNAHGVLPQLLDVLASEVR